MSKLHPVSKYLNKQSRGYRPAYKLAICVPPSADGSGTCFFKKGDVQINDFNNFMSMPKDRLSFSSQIFGDQNEGKHLTRMSTTLCACMTHSYTLGNTQPLSSDNHHPMTFLEILKKIITILGYL